MRIGRTVGTISLVVIVLTGATVLVLLSTWNIAESGSAFASEMTDIQTESNDEEKVPTSVNEFYPVITERWTGPNVTAVTNEMEATYTANFDVKFPREMPSSNYKLQLGLVSHEYGNHNYDDNNHVFLFYSEERITNKLTLNQFWEQGGIWVVYNKNLTMVQNNFPESKGSENYGEWNPTWFNLTDTLIAAKESGMDVYETEINGHYLVAIEAQDREFQGFTVHDPAQVEFMAGNTHVMLRGYQDTEELIEIAESMWFDPS
jgi:hypothetical protein